MFMAAILLYERLAVVVRLLKMLEFPRCDVPVSSTLALNLILYFVLCLYSIKLLLIYKKNIYMNARQSCLRTGCLGYPKPCI